MRGIPRWDRVGRRLWGLTGVAPPGPPQSGFWETENEESFQVSETSFVPLPISTSSLDKSLAAAESILTHDFQCCSAVSAQSHREALSSGGERRLESMEPLCRGDMHVMSTQVLIRLYSTWDFTAPCSALPGAATAPPSPVEEGGEERGGRMRPLSNGCSICAP